MRRATSLVPWAALVLALAGAGAAAAGDVRRGREVYAACASCHEPGLNALGPPLKGVVGRTAGTLEGFRYSNAMRRSGIVWTPETLSRFIADPQGQVKGNRMPSSGLANAAQVDDLVAYLQTLK
ncbi:c-type cytochrome [Phenylobacterium sp. LjRoot225]|uniref:c-type cytochrome n=1 Tax=Phenylobacterium sp. LjRoot225 TaxID=3342285 RepID=UPI003ECFEADC